MPKQWGEPWAGGRTYLNKAGEVVFVLERQSEKLSLVGLPKRPRIALGVVTKNQALAQLARFEEDPVAYVRARLEVPAPVDPKQGAPLLITDKLIEAFEKYLNEQGRTARYVQNVKTYLEAWAEDLAGRDLRSVRYPELLQALAGYPRTVRDAETGEDVVRAAARKHRIAAIKSLTAWLREVQGTLSIGDDPTIALKVPPARPEKAARAAIGEHKGYEMKAVERLYAAINGWKSEKYGWKGTDRVTDVQPVRDVLLIHCKTGMHATEIERLAKGEGKVKVLRGQGEIAATVTFIHKSGRVHIQSIDAQTLAAVQRLQERGSAPVDSYIRTVVRRAAKSIGMKEVIRFGELRHSFVTWARESGVKVQPKQGGLPLEDIASVIGHQSIRTTARHYDNMQVPPMVKLPINLVHPDDRA